MHQIREHGRAGGPEAQPDPVDEAALDTDLERARLAHARWASMAAHGWAYPVPSAAEPDLLLRVINHPVFYAVATDEPEARTISDDRRLRFGF